MSGTNSALEMLAAALAAVGRPMPTTFHRANLSGLTLAGIVAPGIAVVEGSLAGTDLSNARLRGANVAGSDMRGVILRDADCTDVVFRGADLTGADLTGATLTGADFLGAVGVKNAGTDGAGVLFIRVGGVALIGGETMTMAEAKTRYAGNAEALARIAVLEA